MRRILLFIVVGIAVTSVVHAQPPRFTAMMADGTRVDGRTLTGWHAVGQEPKLDGKPLLAPGNPLRWLRDRTRLPGPVPRAFIETVLGDRLPGDVISFHGQQTDSFEPLPAHFVVEPSVLLKPQKAPPGDEHRIRVARRFVRRIVWQRRDVDRYEPGTLFYRDGRIIKFRSIQFGEDYVSLLLPDGLSRAFFSEIAEVHLPPADAWDSYFDELAALSPNGESLLIQVETTGGLSVTGSTARFDAWVQGNPASSDRWVHGLQPAWSLDLLWIPNTDIWVRRVFAPHELPLSRLHPQAARQSSPLGVSGRDWRRDRNVHGGPLADESDEFGWGFGVHAHSELDFRMHPCAKSLHARVGLDRAAGPGGCVRAKVHLGSTKGDALFASDFLVGSGATVETGEIPLPDGENGKSLILQIDAAHAGRPAGADPLDIRDLADWFDPLVRLDEAALWAEVRRRIPRHMPAWSDWTVSLPAESDEVWLNYRAPSAPSPGTFVLGPAAQSKPLVVRRKLKLGADDNWLLLLVDRHGGKVGPKMQVAVDGEVLAEFEVPVLTPSQRNPIPQTVSLSDLHGRGAIEIEIRQDAGTEATPVHWQAIRISHQLPTLYQLFEDRGKFVAAPHPDVEPGQQGTAELFDEAAHAGARSIKITPGGQFRLKLRNKVRIRKDPAWGEYRYLRFAFRKAGGGRLCLELNHNLSQQHPVRYDAGLGDPCWGQAKRLRILQLPDDWLVFTQDLYTEFGEFDVSALTLSTPDGEYALFDHIYLARTNADLDSIPNVPSPEETNEKARRELARPVIEKALPATVAIDMGDGRMGTGVLVDKKGTILTAGHVVIKPDRDVTVHLADGRIVNGKTRGVYRDGDLAAVTITDPGEYPFVSPKAIDESAMPIYVGVAHTLPVQSGANATAESVTVRRVFLGMIWTGFELGDWSAGGPLIDHSGSLVGIHVRRSRLGGFLYSRLDKFSEILPRLTKGEVWGTWQSGTGPVLGVDVTPVKEGCRVDSVWPESPAAGAGIKSGDIIARVEGRSVVSAVDVADILADKDPGQQVNLDILRDGKTTKVQTTLLPHFP